MTQKESRRSRWSLAHLGARTQFEIAIVLISILPLLTLWYLVSRGVVSGGGMTLGHKLILALVIVLVCLGYVLLRKYPVTIIKLRRYLESMAGGEIPDEVSLEQTENDINAIREYLNVIVGQLSTRIEVMEREKELLEKQLNQARKLESMGELAAGIAHEINTPVQFVGDNTRFLDDAIRDMMKLIEAYKRVVTNLEEGDKGGAAIGEIREVEEAVDLPFLKEEIPKAISQSQEGLDRVADIVNAMRDLSWIGKDERVKTDINKAIDSTVIVSRNEWKYVAEVETDLDSTMPPVTCFPGEVKQALLGLIVNAAHAIGAKERENGEKGIIHISTSHTTDWAEIRICDNGTGIPEDVRGKVFDQFFTTKKEGEGTGQGLAIAHAGIVKKQGGKLTFETEAGKGTTFLIGLPLINSDP